MAQNKRNILGADVIVSARRQLTKPEMEKARELTSEAASDVAEFFDFFTMILQKDQSKLTSIRASTPNYPLYGGLFKKMDKGELSQIKVVTGVYHWTSGLTQAESISLKVGALNVKPGFEIGKDTTVAFQFSNMTQRLYISLDDLSATGLLQKGSTMTHSLAFKLKDPQSAKLITELLLKNFTDPSIRIETPEEAGQAAMRPFAYLSDFLGLVSLVSLLLGSIGCFFLLQLLIKKKTIDFAIYHTLGMSRLSVLAQMILQFSILSFLSATVGYLLARLFNPVLQNLIQDLSGVSLSPILKVSEFFAISFVIVLSSLLLTLPLAAQLKKLKISQLFGEVTRFNYSLNYYYFIPFLVFFWCIAVWFAHSYRNANYFCLSLIGAIVGLYLIGSICLWILRLVEVPISRLKNWTWFWIARDLTRRKNIYLLILVCWGTSLVMIFLIPQLKSAILTEIDMSKNTAQIPNLFLFDIQDEQLPELKDYIKKADQQLAWISPMVRARVLSINGESFEKELTDGKVLTREEEKEARFRNRGVNLSYRDQLSTAEKVIAGPEDFKSNAQNPEVGLSIEKGYAETLGLKIGDVMLFDIQGVEQKAVVRQLRTVKWTSFQPNFFILVEPGILDEAPKTWLAGLLTGSDQERSRKSLIDMNKQFPNISAVDVSLLMTELRAIIFKMSRALELMSYLVFLSAQIIIFLILRNFFSDRGLERNYLRLLGAEPEVQGRISLITITAVYLIAASTAVGLALTAGAILQKFIFQTSELSLRISFLNELIISSVASLAIITIIYQVSRREKSQQSLIG